MYTTIEIKQLIANAITEVTGIVNIDDNTSIIGRILGITPADIIYIFDILEQKMNIPVHSVFIHNTSEVMTIDGLSKALYLLQTEM